MRLGFYALNFAVIAWVSTAAHAQRYNPGYAADAASPIPSIAKSPSPDLPPPPSTVMRPNSMAVLDDKKKLGSNDFVSFRVVEDRDNDSQRLRINDNGELEVPYVGLVSAQGRTCKELAYSISKAVIRAGGFGDFANKRKVKVSRKNGKEFNVDLKRVIEEGHTEEDIVLVPDDQIYVPQRLINM